MEQVWPPECGRNVAGALNWETPQSLVNSRNGRAAVNLEIELHYVILSVSSNILSTVNEVDKLGGPEAVQAH